MRNYEKKEKTGDFLGKKNKTVGWEMSYRVIWVDKWGNLSSLEGRW